MPPFHQWGANEVFAVIVSEKLLYFHPINATPRASIIIPVTTSCYENIDTHGFQVISELIIKEQPIKSVRVLWEPLMNVPLVILLTL